MRRDLPAGSIDAVEKRLRAIRVAGQAIGRGHVFGDIAAAMIDGVPKGFRLPEVFQVDGGMDLVSNECTGCPANALHEPKHHGHLAGCHGWLTRSFLSHEKTDAKTVDLCVTLQKLVDDGRLARPDQPAFESTSPCWYGLWAKRSLGGKDVRWIESAFAEIAREIDIPEQRNSGHSELEDFRRVLETCLSQNLTLDVELVPAGFSDGLRWTVYQHCDYCRAPFQKHQKGCRCCQRSGQGHPEIHRKVRGLRPWVDLHLVLGPQKAQDFALNHQLEKFDPSS